MKVAVLINPRSGTAARRGLGEEPIRMAFQRAGVEADVQVVDRRYLSETVRAVLNSGPGAVVVGGGDGTISTAAGVLAGGEVPLGVLPLGTSNHFAQDLGLPLDLEEAVRTIAMGNVRRIGVGEVNGRIFVNNSVLGFYPQVVKVRRAIRKRLAIDKRIARYVAGFATIPRRLTLDLRIEIGSILIERTTPVLFIGTNPYKMNAFRFGARPRNAGGELFVYAVQAQSRLGLIWLFLKGLVRDVSESDRLDKWAAPALRVDTDEGPLTVFADGELYTLTPPLLYRSLPSALPVLVPSEDQRR